MLGRIFGVTMNWGIYPGKRIDPITMRLLYNGGVSGFDFDGLVGNVFGDYIRNLNRMVTDEGVFDAAAEDLSFEGFVPGGDAIGLTRENLGEYIQYSKLKKLVNGADVIREMRAGIEDGIGAGVLASWTFEEFELRMFGPRQLTADMMIEGTAPFGETLRYMEGWLHEIYREMTEEERHGFTLFATGSRDPPVAGGKWISANLDYSIDRVHMMPFGHNCFGSIDFPLYRSKDEMKQNIIWAITNPGALSDSLH